MKERGIYELHRWLATWLLEAGVPPEMLVYIIITFDIVVILLLGGILYWVVRAFLLHVVPRIYRNAGSTFGRVALDPTVLKALASLGPAIFYPLAVLYVFQAFPSILGTLLDVALLYFVIVLLRSVLTFLDATRTYLSLRPTYRSKPVNSLTQIFKVIAYVVATIVIISILIRRQPTYVLGGLGAASAVLMLVFKDTILGFVASIQLYAMDMVHVDDWVQMDNYGANGNVIEISLTTVKVRNWDRTVTTVPTYALISGAVKNWRYMSEGGARRMKRPLYINMDTIRVCTPDMLQRYRAFDLIREQVDAIIQDKEDSGEAHTPGPPTNLGLFRAYVSAFMSNSSDISQKHMQMVRHLDPTPQGLPVEIYGFINDTRWTFYEDIQSALFDHFIAMVPAFDLQLYQHPSGSDVSRIGSPVPGSG